MMNIVVVDAYAVNPGDLSWEALEKYGHIFVYPRMSSPEELSELTREAEVIITNKVVLSREIIEKAMALKLILVSATGYDNVDLVAAKKRSVAVCNVPSYATDSVVQHIFALILELTNQIGLHAKSVSDGEWRRSPDFSYSKTKLIELAGKTLGIVGLGRIGERTAHVASAFGMKVIFYNRSPKTSQIARQVGLEDVFSQSDFISLSFALDQQNLGFVDRSLLEIMKPMGYLINTARGKLVNEQDLADALNSQKIAGAGLDVLSTEPPLSNNPLLTAANCIITPHLAWRTFEARARVIDILVENLKAYSHGKPINLVK